MSQFEFLTSVTVWTFEFCKKIWVVTTQVFEFSHILSFVTILVFELSHFQFEFCHNLGFGVVPIWVFHLPHFEFLGFFKFKFLSRHNSGFGVLFGKNKKKSQQKFGKEEKKNCEEDRGKSFCEEKKQWGYKDLLVNSFFWLNYLYWWNVFLC